MALRLVAALVALAAVAYAGVLGFMFVNQRALQYDPYGAVTRLADAGLPEARDVAIPVGDGVVNGWYAPPRGQNPLILYLKGNADTFTAEHARYRRWLDDGFGFLAFDYRGFPASPGAIGEAGILADALAAFDWAAGQGAPVVIWGRSLGSGPATFAASRRDARALLLETPFYSALAVAQARYPWLPVHWVMLDQFRVDQWILGVAEPIMIAHGTADSTIPSDNSTRLEALLGGRAELWIEPGAGHGDLWSRGLWGRARPFFERAMAAP